MAVTFVAADHPDIGFGDGDPQTFPVPGDADPGDLLLIEFSSDADGALANTGLPGGFTEELTSGASGTNLRTRVGWIVLPDPVPATYSVDTDAADADGEINLLVLRGADASDPVAAIASDASPGTTTQVAPSVDGVEDGMLVCWWISDDEDNTGWRYTSVPSGMTLAARSTFGDAGGCWVDSQSAYQALVADGATGTKSASASGGDGTIRASLTVSLVVSPEADDAVAGTLDATLPAVAGSLAGEARASGALDATLPAIEADLTGAHEAAGTLNGTLPEITGDLTATAISRGTLTGTLPQIEGDLEGSAGAVTGTLNGTLPALQAGLTGTHPANGTLSATLPALQSDLQGAVELALTDTSTFVETARPDRFTGTPRPDRFAESAGPDRFTATARPNPILDPTARPSPIAAASALPDRFTGTLRPRRFFTTTTYREETPMALTFVALGPYTQNEIPEALVVRWLRTHADSTTSGLPLHDQTPAWTVTAYIEQPSGGAAIERACEVLDPATLETEFPDAADQMTNGDEGWVRMPWAAGDLDEVPGDYGIQLVASNGALLLKTGDVWEPEVNDGPAAAVTGA